MIRMSALCLVISTSAGFAATCDDQITLTDSQIDTHFATLTGEDSSEIAKVRAYNELCRSDDAAIRDMTQSAALASQSRALKATLLPGLLLQREGLVIQPYDPGDLSDEQRAWIEQNPPLVLQFKQKQPENSCIVLANVRDCTSGFTLNYGGETVSLDLNGTVAEMILDESGNLDGTMVPDDTSLRIPVRARLR